MSFVLPFFVLLYTEKTCIQIFAFLLQSEDVLSIIKAVSSV